MPPRWPRKPSRRDPEFRKLDDRYTYATHLAGFLCSASGLVFSNSCIGPIGRGCYLY
jgi:hypothetical protein